MDQKIDDESYVKKKKRASLRIILNQHFTECEEALASGDKVKIRSALIKLEDKKARLDTVDDDLDTTLIHELDHDKYYEEMKEIERYHDRCVMLKDQLNESLMPTMWTGSRLSSENFSDSDSFVASNSSVRGFRKRSELDIAEWNRSNPKRICVGVDLNEDMISNDDEFENPFLVDNEGRIINLKQEEMMIKDENYFEQGFMENSSISMDQTNGGLIQSYFKNEQTEFEPAEYHFAVNEVLSNNKLLLRIFENLDMRELIVVERVCKKWQKVSLESWKDIYCIDIYEKFNVKKFELYHLEEILRRGGKYLTHLDCSYLKSRGENFASCQNLPAKTSLEIINSYCEKLTSLCLNFTWDEEHYLNFLDVSTISKLKSLTVGNESFCDENLPMVLKNAVHLEKFSIAGYNYSYNALLNLGQKCKTLSVFCSRKFSNEMLKEVLITHPNIENLDISDTDITPDALMPFRNQLNALALLGAESFFTNLNYSLNFNNLKVLDLSLNGENLTGEKLKLLIENCPILQELRLRKAKSLIAKDFIYLLNLKHLMYLDVSFTNISGAVLAYIAEKKQFKQLICHGCHYITSNSINEIIDVSPVLRYLSIPSYRLTKKLIRLALTSLQKRTNHVSLIISLRSSSVNEIPGRVEQLKLKSLTKDYSKTSILMIGYGPDKSCGCDFSSPCICFEVEDILVSFN